MSAITTWRTDDLCPAGGAGLILADDGVSAMTQDCSRCGWSVTWQT